MSETEVILNTSSPRTRSSLAADIHQLVSPGMTVLVHSSLSALGWVCGGPVAVVQTLMDAVTTTGTLVMPTQSGNYSDPAEWQNPPVPSQWWSIIRETMPAYDSQITPTWHMGQIVEVFRTQPGVLRSSHPVASFAAWGQQAELVVNRHSLDNSLGEGSPLARLYDLNGWVLLLGVGYDSSTCFHLAEYRSVGAKPVLKSSPILEAGQRVWKTYQDIEFAADSFVEIGKAFEKQGAVKVFNVGSAQSKLFSMREAVDFAVSWFHNRDHSANGKA